MYIGAWREMRLSGSGWVCLRTGFRLTSRRFKSVTAHVKSPRKRGLFIVLSVNAGGRNRPVRQCAAVSAVVVSARRYSSPSHQVSSRSTAARADLGDHEHMSALGVHVDIGDHETPVVVADR